MLLCPYSFKVSIISSISRLNNLATPASSDLLGTETKAAAAGNSH